MALESITLQNLKYPLIGGLFLATASSTLLNDYGRILGCSGSLHHVLSGSFQSPKSSLAFGLALGGSSIRIILPLLELSLGRPIFDWGSINTVAVSNLALLLISGILSGAGTKLASGCTSGHMLCGMARGSKRSVAATMIFFPVAILTHRVLKPLLCSVGLLPQPLSSLEFSPATFTPNLPIAIPILAVPYLVYLALKYTTSADHYNSLRTALLGATFASGLALSGMTRPSVVLGFFNFPLAHWDPSLLGVAIGGLGLNILVYWGYIKPRVGRWMSAYGLAQVNEQDENQQSLLSELSRHAPSFDSGSGWQLPEMINNSIDWQLVGGSALFGLGWGLSGICPGPGIVVFGAYPLAPGIWSWMAGFFVANKLIP